MYIIEGKNIINYEITILSLQKYSRAIDEKLPLNLSRRVGKLLFSI